MRRIVFVTMILSSFIVTACNPSLEKPEDLARSIIEDTSTDVKSFQPFFITKEDMMWMMEEVGEGGNPERDYPRIKGKFEGDVEHLWEGLLDEMTRQISSVSDTKKTEEMKTFLQAFEDIYKPLYTNDKLSDKQREALIAQKAELISRYKKKIKYASFTRGKIREKGAVARLDDSYVYIQMFGEESKIKLDKIVKVNGKWKLLELR